MSLSSPIVGVARCLFLSEAITLWNPYPLSRKQHPGVAIKNSMSVSLQLLVVDIAIAVTCCALSCHCPLMSSPAVFTQHCHGRSGRHQGGDTIPHHQAQHHTHVSSYRRQSNFGIHILSPGSSIQGSLSRIQCRYHCNSWLSTLSLILLLLLYSVLSPSVAIEIPTLPPSSVSCCCRPHLHYGSYLMRMPHCLP